jgi:hypothetical protein
MSSGQQGNETRTSIIPTGFSRPISYPNYNFADALKTPADLGVQVGDSFGDVLNAAKGIIYYTDMIGFGQSSNSLDADLNPQPLGINYFVDSGKTCSNGANMWQYMSNIPDGDALGGGVQRAMSQLGLPGLKGLAPGMVQDLENAMDPTGMANSVFGTGYPQCKLLKAPVGDVNGNIVNPVDGTYWITDEQSAVQDPSTGKYYQEKWVQDKDQYGNPIYITADQFSAAPKTQNPDGSALSQPTPAPSPSSTASTTQPSSKTEGFVSELVSSPKKMVFFSAILCAAFVTLAYKKR